MRQLPHGGVQDYKLVDSARGLSAEEWERRVVAVFVAGQAWQFKDWVWNTPAELFNRVLGVHLAFEGGVVDPNVLSWNCRILKVNFFFLYKCITYTCI